MLIGKIAYKLNAGGDFTIEAEKKGGALAQVRLLS
jgi:hypothetical protein